MFRGVFYFFIFILGTCVGSFLNCVIYRLSEGRNFFSGRSYCPKCKHILKWQDLVPIFSFLFLKGKCRYCKEKIALQYPLVEFFTGLLFIFVTRYSLLVTSYSSYNLLVTGYWLLVTCFLIIIFVYDFKYYIIPDKIIYPAIGTTFLYQLFRILNLGFAPHQKLCFGAGLVQHRALLWCWVSDFRTLLNPLLSATLASAFFLLIVLISKGKWMGLGDVKMTFFMGNLLGSPAILVALFSAFFIGAIIGIGLIILGKKTLKSEVPFGPFLVIGTFLAMFWGGQVIGWYSNLFNLTI